MVARRKFIKSTSLLIGTAGTMGYKVSYSKNLVNKNGAMIHNVYFWLKNDVTNRQKKEFEKGLKGFLDAVKEIEKYEIGIPADTPNRDVVDKTFGYSIFVWFNNVEDHNIYQKHPAHDEFISSFSSLWTKVQVLDSGVL